MRVTIHKSQGLTLPTCGIDLGSGAFEHGQPYVAVSRVPSFADFSLKSPLTEKDLKISNVVQEFHTAIGVV